MMSEFLLCEPIQKSERLHPLSPKSKKIDFFTQIDLEWSEMHLKPKILTFFDFSFGSFWAISEQFRVPKSTKIIFYGGIDLRWSKTHLKPKIVRRN